MELIQFWKWSRTYSAYRGYRDFTSQSTIRNDMNTTKFPVRPLLSLAVTYLGGPLPAFAH